LAFFGAYNSFDFYIFMAYNININWVELKKFKGGNMKKVVILLLSLVLIFSVSAFAKSKSKVKTASTSSSSSSSSSLEKAITGEDVSDWAKQTNLIEINPLDILLGTLFIHYEMAMGKANGGAINAYDWWFSPIDNWNFNIFGVNAEYNWYFQKHALNGWFAGPSAGLQLMSFSFNVPTVNPNPPFNVTHSKQSAMGFGITIGGQGGYRWIWDNGFTLDCVVGLGYGIGSSPTIDGVTAAYTPLIARWGVELGYAWGKGK
jgi:hypothetical protein